MSPFTNGIYFKQHDIREEGYYVKNEDGELVHMDYEKPTLWNHFTHFLKFGYPVRTTFISVDFLHFCKFDSSKKIYIGYSDGDAVTVAKKTRKSYHKLEQGELILVDECYKIEREKTYSFMYFEDNSKKIVRRRYWKDTEIFLDRTVYTFLDWNNL